MDFTIIVILVVRVWVLTIFTWTIRWIAFPWLSMYPYIPPVYINIGIWRAFAMAILMFTTSTFIIFMMLWGIYTILNMLSKKMSFPMKIIRRVVMRKTPFKELKRTGMFDFLDSIIYSILRRDPNIFIAGLFRFWQRNIIMLTSDLGRASAKLQSFSEENPSANPEDDQPVETPEPEEPYQTSDQREVDSKLEMCIHANIQPLYPGDNSAELARKKLENRVATVKCQTETLQNSLSIFSFS